MYIYPIRKGDSRYIQAPNSFRDPSTGDNITINTGWTITLYVKGNSNNFSKVADNNWKFNISKTEADTLSPGNASYAIVATKNDLQVTVDQGVVEILASVASATGAFEFRTQDEIDLDSCSEAIRQLIAGKVKSYSIGGRNLTKVDIPELMIRESELRRKVNSQKRLEKIRRGEPDPRRAPLRFK